MTNPKNYVLYLEFIAISLFAKTFVFLSMQWLAITETRKDFYSKKSFLTIKIALYSELFLPFSSVLKYIIWRDASNIGFSTIQCWVQDEEKREIRVMAYYSKNIFTIGEILYEEIDFPQLLITYQFDFINNFTEDIFQGTNHALLTCRLRFNNPEVILWQVDYSY